MVYSLVHMVEISEQLQWNPEAIIKVFPDWFDQVLA
jgi:hypothetical protein